LSAAAAGRQWELPVAGAGTGTVVAGDIARGRSDGCDAGRGRESDRWAEL